MYFRDIICSLRLYQKSDPIYFVRQHNVVHISKPCYNQAVPKHAVSAVLGTRFSAASHAAAISAEPRFLAVFSWVFLVLAEKLHIPGVEPETKRMLHLNTTNQTKLSHQQNDFQLKFKNIIKVMNSKIYLKPE
ncbi:Hypothetical_protein [Hexamita inflata]|uniref:Hypothetical_protein n=1 Tax=Hexamita inflata TaxID=28002 RepID=A0AA86UV50_9EUKA|nr:Hypothetical protein HINF_LOCUS38208 [Hexamita inflata]